MKLISKIQERAKERNNYFLALDVLFTLSTVYFAVRVLLISKEAIESAKYSDDFPGALIFAMTFSLGLSYAVRFVESVVSKKRKYVILYLTVSIFALGISAIELWWFINPK